jgi:hypothetical protein
MVEAFATLCQRGDGFIEHIAKSPLGGDISPPRDIVVLDRDEFVEDVIEGINTAYNEGLTETEQTGQPAVPCERSYQCAPACHE